MSTTSNSLLTAKELASDPLEVFSLMGKLGEGSYGAVHKAMHNRTSAIVAIKIIPIENDLSDSVKEVTMMMDCQSSYVVSFYGSYVKDSSLWIVMEFCGAGSVSDVMRLTKNTLSEPQIACICKSVLKGLKWLHEHRRIHRDIKAGNILLNSKGEAKLADFGVAGQLTDNITKRQTVIGTPFWMAPEVIQEIGYGVLADIWSLGITCIEMAEGRPPYHKVHPMRAIFMIPTKPAPKLENESMWSTAFINFIARCLTKDPTNRPSAKELLEDPFVKSAPQVSVMTATISTALDLIAQGALEKEEEEEEEYDEDEDDEDGDGNVGTVLFHGGNTADATIKKGTVILAKNNASTIKGVKKSGTIVVDSKKGQESRTVMLDSDSDEDESSTMIRVPTRTPVKSSKLKVLTLGADSTIKVSKKASRTASLLAPKKKDGGDKGGEKSSLENLQELLQLVELNMEKELQATKVKYERKRAPILEAIEAKRLMAAQNKKQ